MSSGPLRPSFLCTCVCTLCVAPTWCYVNIGFGNYVYEGDWQVNDTYTRGRHHEIREGGTLTDKEKEEGEKKQRERERG